MNPRSSATDTLKILLVGDMHLGVAPGHLPVEPLAEREIRPRDLGPGAAWRRVVEAARGHAVHAVALAGDLVDGDHALFEAFGPLEEGIRELTAQGIPVVAVAGNHDTEVLPRLAALLEGLHLLGPGGTWTSFVVEGPGGLEARLTGWSFPRPHVETSPLSVSPPAVDPRRTTIGLLHADLDQTTSRYAPVSSEALRQTGYRAWFLGHTHRPDEPRDDGRPFYLGSLGSLHPGETGEHGPVLLEIDAQHAMSLRRLPLAPLRWEALDVDVTGLDAAGEEFQPQLLEAIQRWAEALGPSLDQTLAVGFRLRLTGTTPETPRWRENLATLEEDAPALVTDRDGTVLFIDRIEDALALPLDLPDLARFPGPEGLLARRILVLEGFAGDIPGIEDPAGERGRLLRLAGERLAEVDDLGVFRNMEGRAEEATIAGRLARTGRRALEEILTRKEAGRASG